MFASKSRSQPQSESPKTGFTCVGSGLTKAKLEKLASDKHSSLLQKFVTYGRKKLYNVETRQGDAANEERDEHDVRKDGGEVGHLPGTGDAFPEGEEEHDVAGGQAADLGPML